jgi:hypothetical protein
MIKLSDSKYKYKKHKKESPKTAPPKTDWKETSRIDSGTSHDVRRQYPDGPVCGMIEKVKSLGLLQSGFASSSWSGSYTYIPIHCFPRHIKKMEVQYVLVH